MPTLDVLLSELIRRLDDTTPDTSITLSGGLTLRATRQPQGYRITAERKYVKPSEYETRALRASLWRIGFDVQRAGTWESGVLHREWMIVERHGSNPETE